MVFPTELFVLVRIKYLYILINKIQIPVLLELFSHWEIPFKLNVETLNILGIGNPVKNE